MAKFTLPVGTALGSNEKGTVAPTTAKFLTIGLMGRTPLFFSRTMLSSAARFASARWAPSQVIAPLFAS